MDVSIPSSQTAIRLQYYELMNSPRYTNMNMAPSQYIMDNLPSNVFILGTQPRINNKEIIKPNDGENKEEDNEKTKDDINDETTIIVNLDNIDSQSEEKSLSEEDDPNLENINRKIPI